MRKRIVVLWISCAIACWGVDFQGKVLDAKGLPVSGATVIVAVSSIDGPVKAAITWTAQSAPDGTYKVPGLAAGPYVMWYVRRRRPPAFWTLVVGSPRNKLFGWRAAPQP